MKILVTSGAWQAALACVQSLGRAGHKVCLIDQDPNLALAHSKYCHKQYTCPSEKNEEYYIDFLLSFLAKKSFDVLIPISDDCIRYCSKNAEDIKQHVKLLVPNFENILLAANKKNTYLFAIEHNIPIPKTYFPPNLDEVSALSENKIYPCVVKIPDNHVTQDVFHAKNQRELLKLFKTKLFQNHWPIIQEFIPGDVFSLTAVAHQGRIYGYATFKTPPHYTNGGMPPISFSVTDPKILDQAKDLIEALNWTGAIDLSYLKTKEGHYLLLKINPRFSSLLNCAYRLGADLPQIYADLAMENVTKEFTQASYKENIMFRTVFPTEITWFYKRPRYRPTFIRNLFRFKSKTNIYWDDLNLLLWQMKEAQWWCQDIKNIQDQKRDSRTQHTKYVRNLD